METKVIQLRARGSLTLPIKIRERYGLSEGDPLSIIDLDGVLVLSPKVSLVGKIASELESLRKRAGVSEKDLVKGVQRQRSNR